MREQDRRGLCSGCPGAAIGLPLRARTGQAGNRSERPDRRWGETGAPTDRPAVRRNQRAHGQTGGSEKPARPRTDRRCGEPGAPTDRPAVRRTRRAHGSGANDSPPAAYSPAAMEMRRPVWTSRAPFAGVFPRPQRATRDVSGGRFPSLLSGRVPATFRRAGVLPPRKHASHRFPRRVECLGQTVSRRPSADASRAASLPRLTSAQRGAGGRRGSGAGAGCAPAPADGPCNAPARSAAGRRRG